MTGTDRDGLIGTDGDELTRLEAEVDRLMAMDVDGSRVVG